MDQLPEDLKHLYISWLDEEADKHQARQQKSGMILANAARALRNHPEPAGIPEELLKIKGIGNWIVGRLRKRLESYCKEKGIEIPPVPEKVTRAGKRKKGKDNDDDDDDDDDGDGGAKKKAAKPKKAYVPKKKSGGYAILLVLLEFDPDMRGMTKDSITQNAAPYCDSSFSANPSTSQFYSAWSSSKKLIQEGLVRETGRPTRYHLTEEGLELARKIKENDRIVFRDEARSRPDSVATEDIESQYDEPALEVRIPRDRVEMEYKGIRYFTWEPGSFEVKFIVDNREMRSSKERDFFGTKLKQLGVDAVKKPLTLGDGLWLARNKQTNEEVVLNYILERKRLDDLSSSIQDGRYTEQKSRLKRSGIHNVYYLIEEVTSSDLNAMSKAIETSISLALTVSNFHIQRTKDADDTVQFIAQLTKQIAKYYSKKRLLVLNPTDMQTQMDYKTSLEKFRAKFQDSRTECCHQYHTFDTMLSKTSMMTAREMFVRMLMTVRGVTLEKAISIQNEFNTPKLMFDRFDPSDPVFQSKYGKKVAETLAEVFT